MKSEKKETKLKNNEQENNNVNSETAVNQPENTVEIEKLAEDKKKLEQDLLDMDRDLKAMNEQVKRMQADFENYKARLLRETDESREYASEKIICRLLPLVDNMERAIQSAKDGADFESFKKGIELIYKQINDILGKEGLKQLECKGKPYDPNYAEVLMCEDNPEYEDDSVIDELEKGYSFKNKVIRPAKVKVCKKGIGDRE